MRYFAKLSFDGSRYHGWQIQDNAVTVQQVLNDHFSKILQQNIDFVGCGRTDTGVHAKRFFAHFESDNSLVTSKKFLYKINSFLPKDIAIQSIFEVDEAHHARFSASARTYRYYLNFSKSPFAFPYSYYIRQPLDFDKMNQASKYLFGKQDFSSFCKAGGQTKTNICEITHACWEVRQDDDTAIFTITADRFLRNMVRAIVGTLLTVGEGRLMPEKVQKIIQKKNRSEAGKSVPAHALFLEEISYPFIAQ